MAKKKAKTRKKVGGVDVEIYIRISRVEAGGKDTIQHATPSIEEAVDFINKHAK